MKSHGQRCFAAILLVLLASFGSKHALARGPGSERAISPDDQVIADDLIVTGRGCFGSGCANNETFSTELLRLKSGSQPTLRFMQTGSAAQTWEIRANDLYFYVQDVTTNRTPVITTKNAPNYSVAVDASGNIGLGTFTPAGKLHAFSPGNQLSIFQSSNNQAVQFRLQTNSANRRFVALNAAGTQQSQLVLGDNGAFDFLGATASDVRMSLIANGNVGIGTNTPDQRLSVNGNASKPGGGSWATFSDERLKHIKGEFTSGLDEVLQLKPIRYEYKTDNAIGLRSEGEHVGLGAGAVRKVIPEAVTQNPDGYLMVDNDPIIWTMLNAIKEQNQKMTAQSEEIADLKAQLKRVQAELGRRSR